MPRNARSALLAGLTVCLFAAGCSTSTNSPSNGPAAAARPDPQAADRIEGAWRGAMLVNDEAVAGKLSAEQLAQLETMKMGMEFRSDGLLVLTGVHDGRPYTSRNQWKVVKQTGEEITIRSIEPSGAEKEIVLVFEGEDVFLLPVKTEVADLGAMRFERLR